MSKILIITEKPDQARQIAGSLFGDKFKFEGNFEGNQITLQPFSGHIVNDKQPNEIFPGENLRSYDKIPLNIKEIPKKPGEGMVGKMKVIDIFNKTKTLLSNGNYDFVINSTDPDREGSYIFWEVYNLLGSKLPVKRFLPTSKDSDYIKTNLLKNFSDIEYDKRLYLAGKARAFTDYHFGMNNTILFGLKLNIKGIKLGRVKLGILAIIKKRENDRNNFIEKYGDKRIFYGLKGIFKKDISEYDGDLYIQEKIYEEKKIDEIFKEIKNLGKGEIVLLNKEEKKQFGGTMYSLQDLQKECGKIFKWSAKKTLDLLDHLYKNELATYPRSKQNLVNINDKAHLLKQYNKFKELFGFKYEVNSLNNIYTDKTLEHYGIYCVAHTNYKKHITENHGKFSANDLIDLYHVLIVKMFKVLGDTKKFLELSIETKIKDGIIFKTKNIEILENGFVDIEKKLYDYFNIKEISKKNDSKKEEKSNLKNVDKLKKGDIVNIDSLEIKKGEEKAPLLIKDEDLSTYCSNPKTFLEESEKDSELVKHFPEAGIGTVGTISSIIEELKKNSTIVLENGRFSLGDLGIKMWDVLPEKFKSILFTAKMEKDLDDISHGKININTYLENSYKEIVDDINNNKIKIEQKKNLYAPIELKINCPKCNSILVRVYSTKTEKFYATCSKSQFTKKGDCDFIKTYDNDKGIIIENEGYGGKESKLICPNCKKNLKENDKTIFCDCKFTIWKNQFGKKLTSTEIGEIIKNGKTNKKLNLVSKDGKKYEAFIELLPENSGKTKLSF